MQYPATPYEAALRLRADYGIAMPKKGESGASPLRRRTVRPGGTPDWHILLILEGEYVISPDSKYPLTLSPGQAVLYPPHMTQDYMLHDDFQSGRTFWVHFFPEVAMFAFLNWPESKAGPGVLKWDPYSALHRQITEACDRCVSYLVSDYVRCRSLSLLSLEEILRLINQVHPNAQLDHLDDRVAAALQYIASHISSHLSAKTIATAVGLSASRLSHLFSVNMECGIMEYVEKQRVSMACSMLSNTLLPVTVIAEKCGFSSAYYFSTRFRKNKSLSPSEYRKLDHAQEG